MKEVGWAVSCLDEQDDERNVYDNDRALFATQRIVSQHEVVN